MSTLDPVGRFAMRYRWILAAIMVVMIFCTGCVKGPEQDAVKSYDCTEQQHAKAISETKAATEIIRGAYSDWYYEAAIIRNCVRKPKP